MKKKLITVLLASAMIFPILTNTAQAAESSLEKQVSQEVTESQVLEVDSNLLDLELDQSQDAASFGLEEKSLNIDQTSLEEVRSLEENKESQSAESTDVMLIDQAPVEETGIQRSGYIHSALYVRPYPNSTESLGILPKNSYVTGLEEGAWLSFTYGDKEAYIAASYLKDSPAEDENKSVQGYLSSSLYVRPLPGSKHSLGILDANTYLEGEQINPYWVEIIYQGQKAYIAAGYLQEGRIMSGMTTSSVYVRPQPGSSRSLGILPKYYRIEDALVSGPWAKFTYKNQPAYIASAYLVEGMEEAEGPSLSGYTTSSLYVRPAPASKGSLGIIKESVPVNGTIVNDHWLRFNFEGKTGYIAAAYVKDLDFVSGYTTSSLFVRPEPNSSRSLGILPKYTKITQAATDGTWAKISYKGKTAYIAEAFISENVEPVEVYVNTTSMYKRSGPSSSSSSLGYAYQGEKYRGLPDGNWFKVTSGNQVFYLASGLLSKTYIPKREVSLYAQVEVAYRQGAKPVGKIVGTIKEGEKITGEIDGAWLHFKRDGKVYSTAAASYASTPPVVYKNTTVFKNGTLYRYNSSGKLVDTYRTGQNRVVVSLDLQYLWVIRNGRLVAESPVIGGKPKTPTVVGDFRIENKVRNTYLTGPTWRSYVSYWIPFHRNAYGIHDASWQNQNNFYYGSDAYLWTGSHGCVNLPVSKAKKIYDNVYIGMPVTVLPR